MAKPAPKWWETEIPIRSSSKIDLGRLTFDPHNPRFTPDKNPGSNNTEAVVAHLARTADIGELVDSISASGYIDIEPLIVLGDGDNLIVLEGNRRLAALMLINDPNLADRVKISLPEISETHRQTTRSILVYRVQERDDARDLIGFKHINGPQTWDAYAKGRYAAEWYDKENQKRANGDPEALNLSDITMRMGDKHDTINRIVVAVFVLDQAEENDLFKISDRSKKSFSFSHLYTGLSYAEIREFIGMPPANRVYEPSRNPVPSTHYEELRQLLIWLYGSASEQIEAVVKTQNPYLSFLRNVIGHPKARALLLATNDLATAMQEIIPASTRLNEHLLRARTALVAAQSTLEKYDGRDEFVVETALEVKQSAEFVERNVSSARTSYLHRLESEEG
jgi:hypothetical protein